MWLISRLRGEVEGPSRVMIDRIPKQHRNYVLRLMTPQVVCAMTQLQRFMTKSEFEALIDSLFNDQLKMGE